MLSEPEALAVLAAAGIATPRFEIAADPASIGASANRVGFPLVLKIVSPDIAHKSDVGGVRVGLLDAAEVEGEAERMLRSVRERHPNARIDGFMVQAMIQGAETVAAVNCEGPFGPVLTFGLGGVWIEVMRDIAQRLVPVSDDDVDEMIAEIKGHKLLDGFRGQPAANKAAIRHTLSCLSALTAEVCDEIAEVEINPLIAGPDGALAADALIRLRAMAGTTERSEG
jgi:acetyltransferase